MLNFESDALNGVIFGRTRFFCPPDANLEKIWTAKSCLKDVDPKTVAIFERPHFLLLVSLGSEVTTFL